MIFSLAGQINIFSCLESFTDRFLQITSEQKGRRGDILINSNTFLKLKFDRVANTLLWKKKKAVPKFRDLIEKNKLLSMTLICKKSVQYLHILFYFIRLYIYNVASYKIPEFDRQQPIFFPYSTYQW